MTNQTAFTELSTENSVDPTTERTLLFSGVSKAIEEITESIAGMNATGESIGTTSSPMPGAEEEGLLFDEKLQWILGLAIFSITMCIVVMVLIYFIWRKLKTPKEDYDTNEFELPPNNLPTSQV